MAQHLDSDVIIIGCGPTGATLALALAGMGHTVTIIERETAVYPLPRAVHIDDEIMRVFQNLGLMEAITAFIHPGSTYDFRNAAGDTLLSFATDLSHQPLGWPSSNMIYQPGIEGELPGPRGSGRCVAGSSLRLMMLAMLSRRPLRMAQQSARSLPITSLAAMARAAPCVLPPALV
jgi:choline dehydrogenase-like flavoprotein